MSWQRPGAPPAPQRPPQPAQTYGHQQQQTNTYAGYQPTPNPPNNTNQQYWQQPQHNQNQQFAQFPQADYNNANQQAQYSQTYPAPVATFPAQQAPTYQQGYYQPTQQPPVKTAENWDNWDWGWDDASRNQAQSNIQHVNNVNDQITQPNSNANVIEESFASTDQWNWTSNDQKNTPNSNQNELPAPELPVENNIHELSRNSSNHSSQTPAEEVKTLNDTEVVKERLPNLALGKRFHLENLTPQWSIESQMSQESSDGPHTEGTYRSDNQSRNSNSPLNTDQGSFNYSHPVMEEYPPDWGRRDEPRGDGCDLTDGLQDLAISNREIPVPDFSASRKDSVSSASGSRVPENVSSSVSLNDLPPPPMSNQPPVLLPPPTGFTTSSGTNPFKQTSPFSHKKLPTSVASFPVSNFSANLESVPDNVERPDLPLSAPPAPLLPPTPDNLEVAPRRDRDEYLQTAHLTPDYGENTDFRSAPPAGLRRLVQGGADEAPPPGLARLVPGQGAPERRSGRPELPGDGQASAPRPAPAAPPPAPSALRDLTLDGADYAEQAADDREVTVDGENLQDLSAVSSIDLPAEPSVSSPPRQHAMRQRSDAESSDRERAFNASPRRDKHTRDKEGRYSRPERGYEWEERRGTRDARTGDSPETRRRHRHARQHRYDTEDTDYYSDKERDRRRYREGSHTSRPPRPDDKRRYNTIERDRAHRDKRDDRDKHRDERDKHRDERDKHRDERDKYKEDKRYRDIDPHRPRGGTRARTHDERTRDVKGRDRDREYSEGSRANSRERERSDDDRPRRRGTRHRERDYYDGVYGVGGVPTGGTSAYSLTPAQYAYYENLRRTDPAAYLRVYTQLMAQHYPAPYAARSRAGYEERGSGHSGRSSANAHRHDTYYTLGLGGGAGGLETGADDSLRHAPAYSLRTDISDRDLNTDASLNLQLEESTQRSGRVTPLKYSTAHVKGSIRGRAMVVVRGAYPVDGRPGSVRVLALTPQLYADIAAPTPLVRGVTHKKSVIEYCSMQARATHDDRDPVGRALLWDLLALMLRQNGVVVGADIAELLMKNQREYSLPERFSQPRHESRRGSSLSEREDAPPRPWAPVPSPADQHAPLEETPSTEASGAALDQLREYLTYGNRQEALEWAMSNKLWGHALQLASFSERRVRAQVAARFVAAIPPTDPLHSLYTHLANKQPPAATCCAEERWADWRVHAAIVLANASSKPEHDSRTLSQLGDSLSSRGLLYSAQFCYLTAGEPFGRHPLAPLHPAPLPAAPPRLSLLLADPKAPTLAAFATEHAIFATEIYEYAMSLNQDYDIADLQVYKLVMATRLIDCGLYERALAYIESAARAVTRQPRLYPAALASRLAELADRLRYVDPAATDQGLDDDESAGRSQHWMDQVASVANMLSGQEAPPAPAPAQQQPPAPEYYRPPPPPSDPAQQQYTAWTDQVQTQPVYQPPPAVNQTYADPEESTMSEYSVLYSTLPVPSAQAVPSALQQQPAVEQQPPNYYEETNNQTSYPEYWQDQYSYGETLPPTARVAPRVMPPRTRRLHAPHTATQPPRHAATEDKPSDNTKRNVKPVVNSQLANERDNVNLKPTTTLTVQSLIDVKNPSTLQTLSKLDIKAPSSQTSAVTTKQSDLAQNSIKPKPEPISLPNTKTQVKRVAVPTSLPLEPLDLRSGLRRRVHPKPSLPNEAFITPSTRSSTRSTSETRQLSDLDIQLSHQPINNPKQFTVPVQPRPQRCRYGAVISHTVDSWARSSLNEPNVYKPLIFGGTFPIDTPTTPPDIQQEKKDNNPAVLIQEDKKPLLEGAAHKKALKDTIERSLDRFEAILARRAQRTFAIDAPTSDETPYIAPKSGGGAARPLITMPGGNTQHDYEQPTDDEQTDQESESSKPSSALKEKPSSSSTTNSSKQGEKSAGWLGGILTKLSLRAPNQMILPDDKNPSIVWDDATKRWRNVDGSEEDAPPPQAPPPLSLPKPVSTSSPLAPPTAAPVSNIFKMQKGRHIKKSYVDVFNPSGAAPRLAAPAPAEVLPPAPPAHTPNYFVPPSANQSGIYEQGSNDAGI